MTERKQSGEARERAEHLPGNDQYLAGIVHHVVDGVIAIDEQGVVITLNPAAERLFGYESEEVIGHNVSMLMFEPYRSEHDLYIANYLRSGEGKIIGRTGRVLPARNTERADLERERRELETEPDLEHAELARIYVRRGVSPEVARHVAEQLMARDALGAHAREELGLSDITSPSAPSSSDLGSGVRDRSAPAVGCRLARTPIGRESRAGHGHPRLARDSRCSGRPPRRSAPGPGQPTRDLLGSLCHGCHRARRSALRSCPVTAAKGQHLSMMVRFCPDEVPVHSGVSDQGRSGGGMDLSLIKGCPVCGETFRRAHLWRFATWWGRRRVSACPRCGASLTWDPCTWRVGIASAVVLLGVSLGHLFLGDELPITGSWWVVQLSAAVLLFFAGSRRRLIRSSRAEVPAPLHGSR